MWNSSINKMNLLHSRFEGFDCGSNFWDHSTGDDSGIRKGGGLQGIYGRNQTRGILWVAKKSGDVRDKKQLGRFKSTRECCGGEVRVDVESLPGVDLTAEG